MNTTEGREKPQLQISDSSLLATLPILYIRRVDETRLLEFCTRLGRGQLHRFRIDPMTSVTWANTCADCLEVIKSSATEKQSDSPYRRNLLP